MNQEARIQKQVVDWWALACRGYRLDARLLWHTPNGGKRSRIEAAIFKGMGVRSGVPDLFLAVPFRSKGGIVPGLFIEMKAPEGRMQPEQTAIIDLLQSQGFAVIVAWSFEDGIGAIKNYLKTGNPLLES